jgi:hypothetical protein
MSVGLGGGVGLAENHILVFAQTGVEGLWCAVAQDRDGGDWFVRQGKNTNENQLDRDLHLERPSPAVQPGRIE